MCFKCSIDLTKNRVSLQTEKIEKKGYLIGVSNINGDFLRKFLYKAI
jgi:hypothetical protein